MPVLPLLHADRDGSGRRDPFFGHPERGDPFHVQVGLIVAAAAVMLDQATKHIAEELLTPGRMVPLLGNEIGWQLTYNPGGAFGFPAPSWIFLVVTVVVTVFAVYNLPRSTSAFQAAAWGLLLAGALGNALDRVFRPGGPDDPRYLNGEVVDFVAWGSFPRFNIADTAITIGFVLLVVSFWLDDLEDADEEQ
ncbi:MAG: signal peptidase II [Nitriliruptorales bacterium]|nr:signal peptidase II [Nitriliruptorales bacterium]